VAGLRKGVMGCVIGGNLSDADDRGDHLDGGGGSRTVVRDFLTALGY